ASLRDAATDFLHLLLGLSDPYAVIVPRLQAALASCGTSRIVDLAAGGSGPWPRLLPRLLADDDSIEIHLTDKFPNHRAFAAFARRFPEQVTAVSSPVDAGAVPAGLAGFRTLFTSFHHFPPHVAREVLADAVRRRQGIGIFEATRRSPAAIAAILPAPLLALAAAPFISPFRWSRLFWTYVVPALPALIAWDGFVSCLRTYTPRELRALIASVAGADTYVWQVGEEPNPRPLIPVTYVVGYPA
ncbi:MAG TPA: class I SAM-dependent methyltransferase, partial [Thermoanaerobaculia bacterium]|nr:class I SAM-dependent methyltransferase [Thermoanaerobaculia bacterium]